MSDRDLAPRAYYKYAASAVTITDADAPAGASAAGATDAGGVFVLMAVAIGAATGGNDIVGTLVYDDGPSAAVTVLDTNVGLTQLNIQFDMRHASSTLVFTVTGGTTPNATLIGYWK